ncbi:MAG: PAS domain S-box protein [Gammaproteobacteria bacterium]
MHWSHKSPATVIGISIAMALMILIFDLSISLGVAAGAPYIVLVLIGFWAPWRHYIYLMAGIATILTIIGYYASPHGGIDNWVVLSNRGLTLFAIWAAAVLCTSVQMNEERFHTAIDKASDGIIYIDKNGIILSFNMGAQIIFGYTLEEVLGKNVSILMPSPYREDHDEYLSNYLKKHDTKFTGENRLQRGIRKDGTTFPMELSFSEARYRGELTFIGTIDISERQRAQEQLILLSRAVQQSPVSILITDTQGNIEYVNPKFVEVTGYSYDEVIGKDPSILKSGDTPAGEYKKLWDTITSGNEWRGMLHNVKKNGEKYWESVSISPVRNLKGDITHYLSVKEDITEHLETKDQLVHALKMEAAGQLTSGITHDFNNLLTIIIGNLTLLLEDINEMDNQEMKEILDDALSAAKDGENLIQRLMFISRKQKHRTQRFDVNDVISDISSTLKRMLSENIVMKIDQTEGILMTDADRTQFESAILNLAVNAQDAMPKGGILTIKTARTNIHPIVGENVSKQLIPGVYISITVTDTGFGMEQEIIEHACEPFYTTKDAGKGTGLGLSMVHSFAKQSSGDLHIKSEPGKGAAITIFLCESEHDIDEIEVEEKPEDLPIGTETILVVEDNENVRRFAVRSLKNLGYHVMETGDADTAMEILSSDHSLNLLFSDIVIPGNKNGREVAAWAKEECPELKVALTTGMLSGTPSQNINFPLLKKPYSIERLAHFIRDQLDSS